MYPSKTHKSAKFNRYGMNIDISFQYPMLMGTDHDCMNTILKNKYEYGHSLTHSESANYDHPYL